MSIDPKGCFPIYLLVFPLAVARCHISGRPLHTLGACRLFRALFSDSLCRHAAADGRHAHAHAMRACDAECRMSFRRSVDLLQLAFCSFFRELISAEVLRVEPNSLDGHENSLAPFR